MDASDDEFYASDDGLEIIEAPAPTRAPANGLANAVPAGPAPAAASSSNNIEAPAGKEPSGKGIVGSFVLSLND